MVDYIDIVSESVSSDQGNLDVVTAGDRSMRFRVPGPYAIGGSIDLIVNPENMTKFLYWALGSVSHYAGASVAFKHEYTPAQALESFTMEIAPAVPATEGAVDYQSRLISGCVIPSFTLEAVARELLTATIDVIGRREGQQAASSTDPPFSDLRPFVFHEGVLSYDSSDICHAEAFRMTFDNDIPDDVYFLGSRFRGGKMDDGCGVGCDPVFFVQGLKVSGDMDIAFTDWTWWHWFWGSGTATGPSNQQNPISLNLVFTGLATGDATYPNYAMEIYLPEVYLDTSEASIDTRDRIVQSLPYTAIYNASAGYVARIRVVNLNHTV